MPTPKLPGYNLLAKIGSGTFADVYKARRLSSQRGPAGDCFAIKCILKGKLSSSSVESIFTEIKLLKLLNHPHIVQMIDFCWDDNFIYIVMEYCEGGDLSTFIKTRRHLSENVCRLFLQQLASALEYLRGKSYSHMDLKPQNLLLTSKSNPKLKLTDFGLAQLMGDEDRETSLRGSPLYMAPEILKRQPYDASVDLWSTGVILYECLFGRAPYSSQTLGDLIDKIQTNAAINIPSTVDISSECRNLLTRLLERDLKKRITFDEFFSHPFVVNPPALHAVGNRSISATGSRRNRSVSDSNDQDRTQSPGPSRRTVNTAFEELCDLCSTTPSLKTALEIGREGVYYDGEGQYSTAFERYEAALQIIIPFMNKEPKGKRKDLLRQQATLWMDRAENIQALLKRQDMNCAEEVNPDIPGGSCSIQ